jgi:hypothetical protein
MKNANFEKMVKKIERKRGSSTITDSSSIVYNIFPPINNQQNINYFDVNVDMKYGKIFITYIYYFRSRYEQAKKIIGIRI